MKRLISIVLALAVLFTFVGCDDYTSLSTFLDKMNENVLGTSTENSDIAKKAVDDIISKTEEVTGPVVTVTDKDLADKADEEDKAKLDSLANEGDKVTIKVTEEVKQQIESESAKVGGVVITEAAKKAASDKAAELGVAGADVSKVLAPIEEKEKEDLLEKIAATKDNQKAKESFVKEMKQPAPEETQQAVKGTVIVVSSTIDQITKAAETAPDAPKLDEKVTAALKETQKALDDFVKPSVDAEGNEIPLTKADATIVKLAESFLTKTVAATTETTYTMEVTKGAEGQESKKEVKAEVKPKTEIAEEDKKAIAQEAAQLVTALNTMSSASKIDTSALTSLISSLAGGETPAPDTTTRAITRAAEDAVELHDLPADFEQKYIDMINDVHVLFEDVFEGQAASSVLSHFRLLRVGYESYVNNVTIEEIVKNPEFNTIDSFVKYVVTGAMVEADSFKKALFSNEEYVAHLTALGVNVEKVRNLTVYDLFDKIVSVSPAFSEKGSKMVSVPREYLVNGELIKGEDDANLNQLFEDCKTILKSSDLNVESMIGIIEKVAEPVVGAGAAEKLQPMLDKAKEFFGGEAK